MIPEYDTDLYLELQEWRAAAKYAAETAAAALERLLLAEKVVEAAFVLVDDPHSENAFRRLEEAVAALRVKRPS